MPTARPSPTPSAPTPPGLLALTRPSCEQLVRELGGLPVHARSLRRTLLRGGELAAAGASLSLPRGLLARLRDRGHHQLSTRLLARHDEPEGASRLVLGLTDGHAVECVVMRRTRGATACISTQVGCPVGCPFCASGIGGVVRNLTATEILEQFAHAGRVAPIDRVVVMGIGEPLLNLRGLLPALAVAGEELPLPDRRLVISTVGWPDRLARLTEHGREFGLAISLHATDQDTRDRLVPALRGVPLAEVIEAARRYAGATRGKVQFEYVVLAGVNDELERIPQLVELLRGVPGFVNFLNWNPVPGLDFRPATDEHIDRMMRAARRLGLVATRRRTRGTGIEAACGQLRRDRAAP